MQNQLRYYRNIGMISIDVYSSFFGGWNVNQYITDEWGNLVFCNDAYFSTLNSIAEWNYGELFFYGLK